MNSAETNRVHSQAAARTMSHHFASTNKMNAAVLLLKDLIFRANDSDFDREIGEAYIEGYWRCSDLVALVRLLVRNRDLLDAMEGGLARLGGAALRLWHAARRNTRTGSRRNIAAHYDLGNDFFALFLSADLMYSSALYATEDDTLEAASTRKLERICQWLQLQPGDRVVEIGTGWGGFALHAAGKYGCRVTTTTISQAQYELAQQRVEAAGLQDKITILLKDYRGLEGQFDKLVSIEMIEAVGHQFFDTYFAKCASLLKPEGMLLLQMRLKSLDLKALIYSSKCQHLNTIFSSTRNILLQQCMGKDQSYTTSL